MSELEYCAFCDGGYAHSGICDKCTTEIGQTGKELADKDRQLAEARAEIEHKDKLVEQMREIINDYRIEHKAWCNHDPDNAKECNCGLSEKVQAALAAERGE